MHIIATLKKICFLKHINPEAILDRLLVCLLKEHTFDKKQYPLGLQTKRFRS